MMKKDSTLLEIITYGHPVLKQKAQEIKNITEDIKNIAANMVYTMHSSPGIGLAAPQINQSIKLITIDLSVGEKKEDLLVLINAMELGCLSVPEINENVNRPAQIVLKGYDLNEKELEISAEGLLARVLCHEVDHINGILFIDHLSPLKKNLIKKKLKNRL
jgi:peptide deformylase